MEGFERRWSHVIKRKKPENLTMARTRALTPEIVDKFLDMWSKLLKEHDLEAHPQRIFNCDEAGFATSTIGTRSKLYVHTLRRDAYKKGKDCGKTMYTVLWCASASGHFIPPFTVYKAKYSRVEWEQGAIPGAKFDVSDSGWMERENFCNWMKHVFIPQTTVLDKPVILCMDGHGSHLSYKTVMLAKENGIILVALPPNTSHALQPFDVAVFSKLKAMWRKVLVEHERETRMEGVSKNNFPVLMKRLWGRLGKSKSKGGHTTEISTDILCDQSIVAGFKEAGLLPIDRSKLDRQGYIFYMNHNLGTIWLLQL